MRSSLIAAVLLLAAGLAALPAGAQELTGTLKKIKDTGSITLGHRESSIPFSYYDDKQQVVGYSQDLALKVVEIETDPLMRGGGEIDDAGGSGGAHGRHQ